MFGLFKTKEKKQENKQESLEKKLQEFKDKYKDCFNCYAFTGENIVFYKEPKIVDNELVMTFIKADTPKGYESVAIVWSLDMKYGEDFLKKHTYTFAKIKDQLEKFKIR